MAERGRMVGDMMMGEWGRGKEGLEGESIIDGVFLDQIGNIPAFLLVFW